MMNIGARIRELRQEQGMTQEELAHRVGYKSRVSINKIELERDVPIKKLEPIAEALGVSLAYLVGWDKNRDGVEYVYIAESKDIHPIEMYPKGYENLTEEQKKQIVMLVAFYLEQNKKK